MTLSVLLSGKQVGHSSPWRKARKLRVHALKNNTNRPPIACQVAQRFSSASVARPFERCVAIVHVCQSLKIGAADCIEAARPFSLPFRASSLMEQQRNLVSDSRGNSWPFHLRVTLVANGRASEGPHDE
jgi:hypothetical protein